MPDTMLESSASLTEPALSAKLWLVMMKAHQAVLAHALKNIESSGLCFSDFATLELLLNKGPLPVNHIGEKISLTSGSITTAIDRLSQKGLVKRQASTEDRRIRMVSLTEAGHALISGIFEAHLQALQAATHGLSESEKGIAIELLKKMGQQAANLLK